MSIYMTPTNILTTPRECYCKTYSRLVRRALDYNSTNNVIDYSNIINQNELPIAFIQRFNNMWCHHTSIGLYTGYFTEYLAYMLSKDTLESLVTSLDSCTYCNIC
jgi:hypothetical protein